MTAKRAAEMPGCGRRGNQKRVSLAFHEPCGNRCRDSHIPAASATTAMEKWKSKQDSHFPTATSPVNQIKNERRSTPAQKTFVLQAHLRIGICCFQFPIPAWMALTQKIAPHKYGIPTKEIKFRPVQETYEGIDGSGPLASLMMSGRRALDDGFDREALAERSYLW